MKCLNGLDSQDPSGKNISGKFTKLELSAKVLYCYNLPKKSIKEIFFGSRHKLQPSMLRMLQDDYPEMIIKSCRLSRDTWNIEAGEVEPENLTV